MLNEGLSGLWTALRENFKLWELELSVPVSDGFRGGWS